MAFPSPAFTIMALGPFCPIGEESVSTRIIDVETRTLEDAMTTLEPRLWIPVPTAINPQGGLTLTPCSITDLHPDNLIQKTPYLKDLRDARDWIENAVAGGMPAENISKQILIHWPDLPLDLSLQHVPVSTPSRSAVDDLLSMVAMPGDDSVSTIGSGGPSSWETQIDGLLMSNMQCIFENREFRVFEAAWRGVETLVQKGINSMKHKPRLVLAPVSNRGLAETLNTLTEKLIDSPPNLTLIDMPFDRSPWSLDLLDHVAQFAENLLSPTAIWLTPDFLNLKRWDDLHRLPMLKHYLEDAAYAKWRKLKQRSQGCWLAATCNRFLSRPLYGKDYSLRSVPFEEKEPLWINPVWALATLVAQSIEIFGWPSRFIQSAKIRLDNLPSLGPFTAESIVTETMISDERIKQFTEIGITPLAGTAGQDIAFIPKETTVAGVALSYQLFFSCLIGYLFRCRKTYIESNTELDPTIYVHQALITLFHDTGCGVPSDLSVEANGEEKGDSLSLAISFSPPRQIIPDSRQICFSLSW